MNTPCSRRIEPTDGKFNESGEVIAPKTSPLNTMPLIATQTIPTRSDFLKRELHLFIIKPAMPA